MWLCAFRVDVFGAGSWIIAVVVAIWAGIVVAPFVHAASAIMARMIAMLSILLLVRSGRGNVVVIVKENVDEVADFVAAGTEKDEDKNISIVSVSNGNLTPTEFPLRGKLTVREIPAGSIGRAAVPHARG